MKNFAFSSEDGMAIILDLTDSRTGGPYEKLIIKLRSYFELLQYAPCTPRIEISLPTNDALTLFQVFLSDEQLNIIAQNTNKNAKIRELELACLAQGGGEHRGGIFERGWVDISL